MLKKLCADLKNFILYASLDKDHFQSFFPAVREQIRKDNRSNLLILSALASTLFSVIFILSFFVPSLSSYTLLYGICTVISVATYILNKLQKEPYRFLEPGLLFYVFAMFAFSIVLGTVYSPDDLAVTFFVFLVAVSLVFVEKPLRFVLLICLAFVLFVVMAVIFKDPSILATDLVNAALFTFFAIVVCMFTMKLKIQKFFLEYQIRMVSETDILTGTKNRNIFEETIRDYDASLLEQTYFVYVDVNGLHELNNTEGHNSGDKMLQTVADILNRSFSGDIYRIGGDEFAVFGTDLSTAQLEEKVDSVISEIEKKGYHVAIGYDFGHSDYYSMEELIRNAETRMYAAKRAYYASSEHDRRSR